MQLHSHTISPSQMWCQDLAFKEKPKQWERKVGFFFNSLKNYTCLSPREAYSDFD